MPGEIYIPDIHANPLCVYRVLGLHWRVYGMLLFIQYLACGLRSFSAYMVIVYRCDPT